MNIDKWLGPRTVYVVEAGSHAYGTSTPESDYDYRGAAIPPKNYFFGLDNFEQAESDYVGMLVAKELWNKHLGEGSGAGSNISFLGKSKDVTVWSLAKMIKLASDGNPNMIELLFTDQSNILYVDDKVMQPFFDIREAFLSKLLEAPILGLRNATDEAHA